MSDQKKPDTIDLPATEWESDRKGKYPRKVLFGLLTDYGPPKMTLGDVISTAISFGLMVLVLNWLK